ncbi:hypothetical protein [Paenibacillus chitinolyticus]|uniref:hypothetical protein n=1 Tax=Paenibacillus chitinolyticus TaxID=79263 RepID=UPI00362A781F
MLQGGDCLPYAEVNFSPLESMDRQLHVYGRSVYISLYIIEAIASKPSGGAAYFHWKEGNRPAIYRLCFGEQGPRAAKLFFFVQKNSRFCPLPRKRMSLKLNFVIMRINITDKCIAKY